LCPAGKGDGFITRFGMYAIIEASGGQLKVEKDMVLEIDLIDDGNAAAGKKITFDKVLLVGGADGKDAKIGQPYVKGASVTAEVVEGLVKGDKLRIQYFQAKKGSRRRTGHRQKYTKVKITAIAG
jgi:large subunit ribosomal protein L21